MDAREFDRDLHAWLDGELPPEHAARMQAAADASPDLARRVAMERALAARVQRALMSDPGSVETVRAMVARARATRAPAGRILGVPRGVLRIAASLLVVAVTGMWWFCIPPFECSYMQALEAASHDPNAKPGIAAEEFAKKYGMPGEIDGAFATQPVATVHLHFWFWDLDGVRLDYTYADGRAVQVVVCESDRIKPSVRRHVVRDGMDWWMGDVAGRSVVAFVKPGGDGGDLCAVTGPAGDKSVYAAAKALRASFH
jgi:hypothetical protein